MSFGCGERRLPRTRGDGPVSRPPLAGTTRASPHTRGWTRRRSQQGLISWRLPRTRGDGPDTVTLQQAMSRASPHTRGWTRGNVGLDRHQRGFPAHAGMDPLGEPPVSQRLRLPRTRGDGPRRNVSFATFAVASPHTRGWTPAAEQDHQEALGFPAHAGMDPSESPSAFRRTRLPRTRGDGPMRRWRRTISAAASPHTRGWTHPEPLHALQRPPHTRGWTWCRCGTSPCRGLPRTRGDGPEPIHMPDET